jgi:hypothetical protein
MINRVTAQSSASAMNDSKSAVSCRSCPNSPKRMSDVFMPETKTMSDSPPFLNRGSRVRVTPGTPALEEPVT